MAPVPQNSVGPGHGGNHQAVPGDDDLVVASGTNPLLPHRQQAFPPTGDRAPQVIDPGPEKRCQAGHPGADVKNVLPFEVPLRCDTVVSAE